MFIIYRRFANYCVVVVASFTIIIMQVLWCWVNEFLKVFNVNLPFIIILSFLLLLQLVLRLFPILIAIIPLICPTINSTWITSKKLLEMDTLYFLTISQTLLSWLSYPIKIFSIFAHVMLRKLVSTNTKRRKVTFCGGLSLY